MAPKGKTPSVEEVSEQDISSDEGQEAQAVEAEVIEDLSDEEAQVIADSLEAAKAEADDLRDRYARLQADWDNYRKRTTAEREVERIHAAERLVKDLLPIIDDLDRAIDHGSESGDAGSVLEGVVAVRDKFLGILEKSKVVAISPQGEPFDATQHQAVGTQEDETVPEETVVQVYQKGYLMGDKVLRPAMVVTSVGGPSKAD